MCDGDNSGVDIWSIGLYFVHRVIGKICVMGTLCAKEEEKEEKGEEKKKEEEQKGKEKENDAGKVYEKEEGSGRGITDQSLR